MKRIERLIKSILLLYLFSGITVTAQELTTSCKVLMPQIAGSYQGQCKKGLAEGPGKAQGVDIYEGNFKKGYPDGQGKYTYENGNVFDGEWQKGQRNGFGILTYAQPSPDTILKGYWIKDEYIGTEKSPFKVNQKGINVMNLNVSRVGTDKDQIVVEYFKNGKPLSIYSFTVTEIMGGYSTISKTDFSKTLLNVRFPFRADMTGGQYTFDLTISQRGSWKVTVNVTDK